MKTLLIALVRFYQYGISPFFTPHCRHVPTCSQYALEALQLHGALKGSWLALRRLGRCHPFGSSGYDPVPKPNKPMEHQYGTQKQQQ